MERRPTVTGKRQLERGTDRGHPQPLGDPGAASGVRLENIDGTGAEHGPEVTEVVAVLTGGDVEGQGLAENPEAVEVVGAHRLLEPRHPELAGELETEAVGEGAVVGAVGVDVHLDAVADGAADGAHPREVTAPGASPVHADLHLHPRDLVL